MSETESLILDRRRFDARDLAYALNPNGFRVRVQGLGFRVALLLSRGAAGGGGGGGAGKLRVTEGRS